jgi:hypoxanthine phosphoribosyltransferase
MGGTLASIDETMLRVSAPRPATVPADRRPSGPYPCEVQATTAPERDIVSWEDLDRLVAGLADRLVGTRFDVMLAITRGGLVPAGMLAYRLRTRNILVAAVEYYDDDGRPGPHPTFLQFPADPLLRGQRVLIVDEVWDSGTTIHAVTDRVLQAGGIPTTAVLHYKPQHSRVPGRPDVYAVETDRWVVYPFKAGG